MHIDILIESAGWWAYLVVFAVTVSETSAFLGLLVPGETVILIAAALAGKGDLNPVILAVAVVTGGIIGDNLGYLLGRRCGRRPSSGRFRRFRPDAHLRRAQTFLVRHGGKAVFTGRFIGFIRTFLPFAAGAAAMPYRRFLFFSTLASVVWGIGNVALGYFAGTAATELLHSAGAVGALAFAAVALAVAVSLRLLKRRRHTGRGGSSIVVSHGSLQAGHDRVPSGADAELAAPEERTVSESAS